MIRKIPLIFALAFTSSLFNTSFGADFEQIGNFDFPTSGSAAAQEHFLLGVGYLHSFGRTQTRAEFQKAQELDPDFAMAYWGETFTYQHPFLVPKNHRPGQVLMRLRTPQDARIAGKEHAGVRAREKDGEQGYDGQNDEGSQEEEQDDQVRNDQEQLDQPEPPAQCGTQPPSTETG